MPIGSRSETATDEGIPVCGIQNLAQPAMIGACLDQQDARVGVLAQARGQHAPGSAGAHDEVVVGAGRGRDDAHQPHPISCARWGP